jgi:hypothetical protein
MEAAVESAMEENDLKAVLVRVTQNGEEVATVVRGESITGVPATEEMYFRNGAVASSYLATVLLQLVDEDVVELDDTIEVAPNLLTSMLLTVMVIVVTICQGAAGKGNKDVYRNYERGGLPNGTHAAELPEAQRLPVP